MYIPHPLASFALARPDHPALIADDAGLTARELASAAAKLAGKLAALGIVPGDTVAIVGPANAAWVAAFHAIGWLGAIAAPLSPTAPVFELRTALNTLSPKLLLAADAEKTAGELGVEVNGKCGFEVANIGNLIGEPDSGAIFEITGDPLAERFWPLDEVRLRLMTSGSTGKPKAIGITTGQLVFSAFGSAIRLGHDLRDRWLGCLPLHHVGGLSILLRSAWLGITAVLHEKFDAARVAAAVDSGGISLVSLVPTMLDRVLAARPTKPFPSSLRAILLGGAPADDSLLDRCRKIAAPVAITWGMTETASQIATREPGDFAADSGVGAPLAFARVTAAGANEGEAGALAVRGPIAPATQNGEFVTADCGFVDAANRVHVMGRADDGLISGGENIFPAEIEAVLRAHPAISEAVVMGVPNAEWGQRPVAVLVARSRVEGKADCDVKPPTTADLRAWCLSRLAGFKAPETFVWRVSLPRNEMGKLMRETLRNELAAWLAGAGGIGVGEQAELAQSIEQHIGNGSLRE